MIVDAKIGEVLLHKEFSIDITVIVKPLVAAETIEDCRLIGLLTDLTLPIRAFLFHVDSLFAGVTC